MKYGWLVDKPDQRDLIFQPKLVKLPPKVDLRTGMPPVYDQGQLGSCTANAIAAALDYERGKQAEPFINPSRLFIYYNERVIEGTIKSDAGAAIRDGIKSIAKQGVCPEPEWPYTISKFASKPSVQCYTDAVKYESLLYQQVPKTLYNIQSALAANQAVVFGFSVYQSFESPQVAKTGLMPMPKPSESVLGGHAVVCVGYDDSKQLFTCRNSWNTTWGDKGYFYMPYAYLTSKNASDLWTIQSVK